MYNARARYYSAELGRFLQNDPIRFDGGDLNLYRYCRNNPVNRTDASGLSDTLDDEYEKDEVAKQEEARSEQGDGFATMDEAGYAASVEAKGLTRADPDSLEYGGEVYSYDDNGTTKYGYTAPRPGTAPYTKDGKTYQPGPKISSENVKGLGRFEAGYHSHPSSASFGNDGAGVGDIPAVEQSGKPLYLGRSGGWNGKKTIVEVRMPTTQRKDGSWKSKTIRINP